MEVDIVAEQIKGLSLDEQMVKNLVSLVNTQLKTHSAEKAWQLLTQEKLFLTSPFELQLLIFQQIFPAWETHPETAPAWLPINAQEEQTNIGQFMQAQQFKTVPELHYWSVNAYAEFWEKMIQQLGVKLQKPYQTICDLTKGVTSPSWLKGAKLNIAESCFNAPPNFTAILYHENHQIKSLSYHDLNQLTNRVANSLIEHGFKAGDKIGIAMPMNRFSIIIYLGIIKMGGVVVSIADSFSSEEIATRLRITQSKGIFTQDFLPWAGKLLPLYEKVCKADAPKAIVLSAENKHSLPLRSSDLTWETFLNNNEEFVVQACNPMDAANILFSSGTTGDPKAIIWNHTTPIKAASDAFFHQNIQAKDVLTWPTNLGWMMGPWLIYAAFINHATIALFADAPKGREFGEFIAKTKTTMLGIVPTIVANWRQTKCMEGLDWQAIKVFSSTGECSNPEDMLYLMSLAGYKPVIEYCGGTEIGGAYISSTVLQNNCPALFSTPAMGSNFVILDEAGQIAQEGEVALIPPTLGLSTELLDADHEKVYYINMPKLNDKILRRHGDQIKQLPLQYYSILGRVDDTMNLGGIKTSAAEIERCLIGIHGVIETAAIAIPPPNNGPSLLIIYAAVVENNLNKAETLKEMQKRINSHLNPLFKIHDIIFVSELPKTASNKIMRRMLRKQAIEIFSTH